MKHLIIAASLALLPAAALAQDPGAAPAAAPAAAALPMCSAKVHDSCQQTKSQQASALDYYPTDCRDAGNNKTCAAPAHQGMAMKPHKVTARKSIITKSSEATPAQ